MKRASSRATEQEALFLRTGDVVIVSYPFSSLISAKSRPAVVVSSCFFNTRSPDVVVMAISSKVENGLRHGECLIEEWRAARLLTPSCVKLSVLTIERRLIFKLIGRLTVNDMRRVEATLRKVLGFYR